MTWPVGGLLVFTINSNFSYAFSTEKFYRNLKRRTVQLIIAGNGISRIS